MWSIMGLVLWRALARVSGQAVMGSRWEPIRTFSLEQSLDPGNVDGLHSPHRCGAPALRMPSIIGSRLARYAGLSLQAVARKFAIVNFGSRASPARTSDCASSIRPTLARQEPRRKRHSG